MSDNFRSTGAPGDDDELASPYGTGPHRATGGPDPYRSDPRYAGHDAGDTTPDGRRPLDRSTALDPAPQLPNAPRSYERGPVPKQPYVPQPPARPAAPASDRPGPERGGPERGGPDQVGPDRLPSAGQPPQSPLQAPPAQGSGGLPQAPAPSGYEPRRPAYAAEPPSPFAEPSRPAPYGEQPRSPYGETGPTPSATPPPVRGMAGRARPGHGPAQPPHGPASPDPGPAASGTSSNGTGTTGPRPSGSGTADQVPNSPLSSRPASPVSNRPEEPRPSSDGHGPSGPAANTQRPSQPGSTPDRPVANPAGPNPPGPTVNGPAVNGLAGKGPAPNNPSPTMPSPNNPAPSGTVPNETVPNEAGATAVPLPAARSTAGPHGGHRRTGTSRQPGAGQPATGSGLSTPPQDPPGQATGSRVAGARRAAQRSAAPEPAPDRPERASDVGRSPVVGGTAPTGPAPTAPTGPAPAAGPAVAADARDATVGSETRAAGSSPAAAADGAGGSAGTPPAGPALGTAPSTGRPAGTADAGSTGTSIGPSGAGPAGNPDTGRPRRYRVHHFRDLKARGEKWAMLTAYDQYTAEIFDTAGIPMLLVGDSAANNVYGYESTLRVTVDELLPLARAVAGSVRQAMVVADLPFGSYQGSPEQAFRTAVRFMKEAGVHAVKLEGGRAVVPAVELLTRSGIPVMAHLGFTPQSEHSLGGYRVQGRGDQAAGLIDEAVALAEAGAFAVVLEMVPGEVAAEVTKRIPVPTIGIGAGPDTDAQVLVWQDLAGLRAGPMPRFVKQYADLRAVLSGAAAAFAADVASGTFPADEHTF